MENGSWFAVILSLLNILLARWRMILVGTIVPTLVAVVVVLVTTSVYRSEALVNPPKSGSGLGAEVLQSMGSGVGGLLGSVFGGGGSGLDECVSILESTRFAKLVIDRFDLETSYGFKKPGKKRKYYFAHVLKKFRRNAIYEITDEDAIRISMKDTSAARAAEMVTTMIHLLDSLYTDVQKQAIHQKLRYVDERLALAEADMKRIEDSLEAFQNKHNLLVPEDQVRLMLQNAAQTQIKLETIKEEIALEAALRGTSSARYKDLVIRRDLLEKTLQDKIRDRPGSEGLIHPMHALPALAAEYYRIERAYLVHQGVYKFLVQQAEMLKLEAGKNIQVVSVIDPPWVNDKRISPKRRLVVQITFFFFLFFWIAVAVVLYYWERFRTENPDSGRLVLETKSRLAGLARFKKTR